MLKDLGKQVGKCPNMSADTQCNFLSPIDQ